MQSINEKYYFSNFAHVVSKNGIYAFYHSLRMKPVFVKKEIYELIMDRKHESPAKDYLEINPRDKNELIEQTIAALLDNKILSKDKNTDQEVLRVFRKSLKQPYVKTAFFLLTDKCNFACKYCYLEKEVEKRGKVPGHMSEETARQAVEFFARLTRLDSARFHEEKQIIFYGGEPLMNFAVLETILAEIKKLQHKQLLTKNLKLNMISNGSLITAGIARKMKESGIGLSISIDGDETATNSSRCYASGKPVYEDIRKGMDICKQENFPFGLSVTLTESSLNNTEKTSNIIFDTGAVSLGLNPILQTSDDIELPADYAERAADFIIESYQKYRKQGISEDRMMRKAHAFKHSTVYPFDCHAAGGNQIIVTPEGKVGICQGLMYAGKYDVTDVYDDSFVPTQNEIYLEWSKRSPLNMDECKDCLALGICGGGCPFVAESKEGSIWGIDRQFCVHAKKTTEWLIFDLFEQANGAE
ncbi:MAG: SPASM domain-containing protein [Bacteroidota bacterium]|nr:SPASM domain-containing protein [Bacteroidota bacterium]